MSRLGLTAAVAVAAALLVGCGSARPGVAVQVGEESISANRVDELAGEYCQAIEGQLEGNNQQVPQRFFRGGIAGTLGMRSVAEQVAAEYDVKAGQGYDEKVSTLKQSVAVLPADVREAVVEVESAPAYVEAVQAAVGERLLAAEGTQAKYSEQVQRGKTEFDAWIAEHGVTFDPALGIALVDGQVTSADNDISFAAGDLAKQGAAEEPDPEYAATLPDSHRCG